MSMLKRLMERVGKKEKEDLDKSWRQRYIERFEGKVTEKLEDNDPEEDLDNDDVDDSNDDSEDNLTYEDLLADDKEE